MAWLRIDDRVRTHPKVVQAGPSAAWLWFCGICYCREHLTDGFIPDGMLASLAPGVPERVAKRLAAKLVAEVLWHKVAGGYRVHDFLDWNPSRGEVLAKRQADIDRKNGLGVQKENMKSSVDFPPGFQKENMKSSTDFPHGFQTDSTDFPHGKITDSTATRDAPAGAPAGLGSGSGSGLGSESSSEGGSGETARGGSLVTSPLAWHKRHGSHVTGLCGWVCLPGEFADELAGRLPGDREQNRLQVEAWARSVKADWQARGQVPAERMYDFWSFRWQEAHGSTKPAAKPVAAKEDLTATIAAIAAREADR